MTVSDESLLDLGIRAVGDGFRQRSWSPVDIVRAALERIEATRARASRLGARRPRAGAARRRTGRAGVAERNGSRAAARHSYRHQGHLRRRRLANPLWLGRARRRRPGDGECLVGASVDRWRRGHPGKDDDARVRRRHDQSASSQPLESESHSRGQLGRLGGRGGGRRLPRRHGLGHGRQHSHSGRGLRRHWLQTRVWSARRRRSLSAVVVPRYRWTDRADGRRHLAHVEGAVRTTTPAAMAPRAPAERDRPRRIGVPRSFFFDSLHPDVRSAVDAAIETAARRGTGRLSTRRGRTRRRRERAGSSSTGWKRPRFTSEPRSRIPSASRDMAPTCGCGSPPGGPSPPRST